MGGNFGLKLQNSPKLPHVHARFYLMQMSKGNCEKGYSISFPLSQQNLNAAL